MFRASLWLLVVLLAAMLPGFGGRLPTATAGADNLVFLPGMIRDVASGMVDVPAGPFQMGCVAEHDWTQCQFLLWQYVELPQHTVYLDAYRIDVHEVTNAEFARFLNERGNNECAGYACVNVEGESRLSQQGESYVVASGYEDHPVILASWYGADTYCASLGKRLPTEAEWEKAARGTAYPRTYPWGEDDPDCSQANTGHHITPGGLVPCVGDTTPVGAYPDGISPYGVLDMGGNAWEWVNDWYDREYYETSLAENPQGPATGTEKVHRGGGQGSEKLEVRVAFRRGEVPFSTSYYRIGFRCAADPETP